MPEYDLLKAISIAALEKAGVCEPELHRFAYLALKEFSPLAIDYTFDLGITYAVKIASQCNGGIRFLEEKGFIREKVELLPCPLCGGVPRGPCSVGGMRKISCSACDCSTGLYEEECNAINRWNTRV